MCSICLHTEVTRWKLNISTKIKDTALLAPGTRSSQYLCELQQFGIADKCTTAPSIGNESNIFCSFVCVRLHT